MRDATAFRGQPLLVFAGVLGAWFGLRVALWQPLSETGLPESRGLSPDLIGSDAYSAPDAGRRGTSASGATKPSSVPIYFVGAGSGAILPGRAVPPMIWIAPIPREIAVAPGRPAARAGGSSGPVRLAVGHSLLLAAGLSQMELPFALAAYLRDAAPLLGGIPAAAPFATALPQHAPAFAGSRLSADAWLMLRQDTTTSVVSGRPSYGRSQVGGVVRYRLAPSSPHGLQAYLRASSALQGAVEKDLVAGISARPMPIVPLRFAAEGRISQTASGSELRPAVIAVSELPRLGLPRDIRAEAYIQAGYVAGKFATAFVDGQARVERPAAQFEQAEIAVGVGAWGGAQKGAARLDIGPSAAVSFRVGEGHGRIAADYRFRIAGSAEPKSGAALTLSAGF